METALFSYGERKPANRAQARKRREADGPATTASLSHVDSLGFLNPVSGMATDAVPPDSVRGHHILRIHRHRYQAVSWMTALRRTQKIEPVPCAGSTPTVPPMAAIRVFTMASPSPVPPSSRERPASTR